MRIAVVLGYNRFGNVRYVAELLLRYGYNHIYILSNDASMLTTSRDDISAVEVSGILQPQLLAEAVHKLPGFDPLETPYLCI
jgi:hypothetical protein